MQYLPHTSILCLESTEFIGVVVPGSTYDSWRTRGKIKVHGRGGNGRRVLIEYESIKEPWARELIYSIYGDPYQYASLQPLRDLINRVEIKVKARHFFDHYTKPNGDLLDDHLKNEYVKAAAVMSMIDYAYENKKWLKKELKLEIKKFWDIVGTMKETKDAELPTSYRHLQPRYNAWKAQGFAGLVTKKIGNSNSLKAGDEVVNLILSLYADDNKPYAIDIYDYYKKFLRGEVHLIDVSTGELYNPAAFEDLGKTTIWNIINKYSNRIEVDKVRMSRKEFNDTHRPHVMRHAPLYAFSKLSMDDISIPFKMHDNKRVWAYEIADVCSGCIVGYSFARSNDEGSGKDRELFKKAVKNMFRTIVTNGWKVPHEIEVEQHISNTFKGSVNEDGEFVADILTDGHLFPFVRWCNAANPQEKRFEHINKGKKYSKASKRDGFQRRPFAKLEANRMNEDKNKKRYTFEEVVANEMSDINEWNNDLHPNQMIYPGMTRWQVLQNHQHPDLLTPHLPTIAKYIGLQTPTSVNRTFVSVQYGKYVVKDDDLGRLNSSNIVTAYYMPGNNQEIPEIYLYQDDRFICTATKMNRFNEAKFEQTEADIHLMHKQQGHIGSFDAAIKKRVNDLKKIQVVTPFVDANDEEDMKYPEPVYVDAAPVMIEEQQDADYWTRKAIEDL